MTARHGHLPRAILVTADLVAAVTACIGAYLLRFPLGLVPVTGRTDVLPVRYLEALPIAVAVMLAAVAIAGLHARRHFGRVPSLAEAVSAGTLAALLLFVEALLYWRSFQYSRLTIVLAAVLFIPLLVVFRVVGRRVMTSLAHSSRYRSSAIVAGGGAPARALARALADAPWMAVDIVAVLPLGEAPPVWSDARLLDGIAEMRAMLDAGQAREVFVALPANESSRLHEILTELAQTSADVRLIPDLGDAFVLNPSASVISGVPVVSIRERPLYGLRAAGKRATDVALSLVLLAALAPVAICIALLVKLTSRGPVLFRQERMGLDGRPFDMLKFRTMRDGAEDATGPVFASRSDARVTPLGRVLRRLSLDELPQLVNVLRGDMSLVGPRPERAPFIEQFRARLPGYMLRHAVKAGMTGWAQVHGLRGDSSLEDRLRYDLEYIDRWSLFFDLEILGRTAVHVVSGRNAY